MNGESRGRKHRSFAASKLYRHHGRDVWILGPTGRPTVTLITCYPFSYVGHAPQRFIVGAERVNSTPMAENP